MTVESPTDGEVFLANLEEVLCPQLPPDQVVGMDNLVAHKVDGVRQRSDRSSPAVSATLLARFQPDRASLVETQGTFPLGQSSHGGSPARNRGAGFADDHSAKRFRFVRSLRKRSTAINNVFV
jgi:hypothetical protein